MTEVQEMFPRATVKGGPASSGEADTAGGNDGRRIQQEVIGVRATEHDAF